MYVYMYVYIHMRMCMCICICVCVYVYVYIYIYIAYMCMYYLNHFSYNFFNKILLLDSWGKLACLLQHSYF